MGVGGWVDGRMGEWVGGVGVSACSSCSVSTAERLAPSPFFDWDVFVFSVSSSSAGTCEGGKGEGGRGEGGGGEGGEGEGGGGEGSGG